MAAEPLLGTDFVNHPDHRAVGQATLDVIVTGGTTAAIFPELEVEEGLAPWRALEEVWLMGPGGGPVGVDVTATLDRKLRALAAHASQMAGWDVPAAVRRQLAEMGAEHGCAYAESFRVVRMGR